jgi:tRNA threonylcarbamoyladenosine biosynthesis protein TsaE
MNTRALISPGKPKLMEIRCNSLNELDGIAAKLLALHPDSRIFALYGKMGAGKTTFIKALCRQLDVVDTVNSPTFAIINEYRTTDGSSVFHFDMYRIKSEVEMIEIGAEEYFYSGCYCFIEWPEMIVNLLPEEAVPVKIEVADNRRGRIFSF